MSRVFPFYPFAIAAAYVLAFWVESGVSVVTVPRPLLVLLLATGLALAVLRLLLGSWHGAGFVLALIMVAARASSLASAGAILFLGIATAIVISAGLARIGHRLKPEALTGAANVAAAVLVLVIVIDAMATGSVARIPADVAEGKQLSSRPSDGATSQPDVYVIVLDGYPRDDTLERLFAYDNGQFLERLRQRGFEVALEARSNYAWTQLTLASMLNLDYVQDLPVEPSFGDVRSAINDSLAFASFRALGYDIVSTTAPHEQVAIRQSDYRCDAGLMTDVELVLLNRTLVMGLVHRAAPELLRDRHRAFVEQAFDCLGGVPESARPAFVVGHVTAPHLPIVFRSDGSPAPISDYSEDAANFAGSPTDFASAFTGQLEYVNARTLETVDRIVTRSPDAYVVVMSDHGSDAAFHNGESGSADVDERFGILFASRVPGGVENPFPSDVTLVNVFRILLGRLGNEPIGLVPNRFYLSAIDSVLVLEEVDQPARRPTR